ASPFFFSAFLLLSALVLVFVVDTAASVAVAVAADLALAVVAVVLVVVPHLVRLEGRALVLVVRFLCDQGSLPWTPSISVVIWRFLEAVVLVPPRGWGARFLWSTVPKHSI
ncbi:MAG: hypothetical protein ACFCBU_04800, partial [Cyanophyceae cyanobacterium]